ncbi:GNAT family N-acetyltransferase [Streptomyces sp. AM 4-1-1]|uniref:GNAT family N-acetyltransferase n=1 Tax=Streptomyces sp. AM 4-1-1 TaxID=3028710 RepID=UPI0023BA218E|nr:GNAT family N-acetyltransferase [Streptomyces sp. AM 4-1-1]WEH36591.1 GNAT family N-acetyltransferase [Streptomyces sp. AM 4-1-1]
MTALGPPPGPFPHIGSSQHRTVHARPHGEGGPGTWIGGWEELTDEQQRRWEERYEQFGTRIQQSPAYTRAVAASGRRVVVVLTEGAVAAFTRDGAVCTAMCDDQPLLADTVRLDLLADLVSDVHRFTGLAVYLPLVDASCAGVRAYDGFAVWERPPNSLVDWSLDGEDLWQRALSRGTSQLTRKRRLVERDGLTLCFGRWGARAAEDVLRVDDRSWKAERGQSMRMRAGQGELYRRLVETGTVTVSFLKDHGRPVAFRMDARIKDRVMCLKWSYDESYRRYSPGLYLLTEGLRREWAGRGICTVDLHGSPDALKDLIHSDRPARVDLWYGDPQLGARRAEERLAFDAGVTRTHDQGRGLRHAFG